MQGKRVFESANKMTTVNVVSFIDLSRFLYFLAGAESICNDFVSQDPANREAHHEASFNLQTGMWQIVFTLKKELPNG